VNMAVLNIKSANDSWFLAHHKSQYIAVALSLSGPSPNLFTGLTAMVTFPRNTPSGSGGAVNVIVG